MNTCMVLSSWSTISMEDVARANGGGMRWFQLTILKDNDLNRELIARAEQSGYRAIVITVDAPLLGKRLVKTPFQLPENLTLGNFIAHTTEKGLAKSVLAYYSGLIDPCLTWERIEWIQRQTKLPIILKGILTAEVAVAAVKHNIQGIIVSNHGGRQLDGVPAAVCGLSVYKCTAVSV